MAMKVIRPLSWRETKLYYRVGSVFKGCENCAGPNVYRSHCPGEIGWFHYCWDCSAIDDECWPIEGGTDKKSPYLKTAERQRRDLERAALLGDEQAFEALSGAKRAAITAARTRAELGGGKAFSEMSKDERLALLIEQNRLMRPAKAEKADRRGPSPEKTALKAQIAEMEAQVAAMMAQLGVKA